MIEVCIAPTLLEASNSCRLNMHFYKNVPTSKKIKTSNNTRETESIVHSIMHLICEMTYQFIVGAVFASMLGFAFIFNSRIKRKITEVLMEISAADHEEVKNSNINKGLELGNNNKKDEVIIVGAGVAGSALAYALGKDGRQVLVIERDLTEPNRIIGELLQLGGYMKLIELGLEDCLDGIDAQPVIGYALLKDGKSTILPYPRKDLHENVAGRSFHHGRFIQRMRDKAASLPNVRFEQGTVTSLVKEEGIVKGVTYKTDYNDQEMSTAYASLTIVSDGCFSNLRRFLCKPKVNVSSCFLGFVLENCQLPYANHAHIVLADPSPIWLYSISSTEIRCGIDVPAGREMPSISDGEMAEYLKTKVASKVPPELHSAFISAIDKGIRLRKMQISSMRAVPYATPGALLVGDALNMRHPFAGGGMTVALSDVHLVRDLLRSLGDLNDALTSWKSLESFYTLRKPMANTFDIVAKALRGVFCSPNDPVMKEMQQVCFDYLSLGGIFNRGLIELVSGLNPQPLWLVPHVFAMTIYCFARLLLPFPSPRRMLLGAKLISDVSRFISRRYKS